jgi:hypothetical protein
MDLHSAKNYVAQLKVPVRELYAQDGHLTTDIGHHPNKKQIGAAGEHYRESLSNSIC